MKGTRRPTLTDVAEAAGVSVATVSYVLSNRPGVTISGPTRERVARYAQDLGYRRNALAAALRSGGLRELALVSSARPDASGAEIAFALAEEASARGYGLVLQVGESFKFDPSRFDGVIVLGSAATYIGLASPLVEIGGRQSECQVHWDDFGGARRGVEYLLSLGHRRIGHFAGSQADPASQERLRGFLDAVHEAGLRMEASPVFHSLADLTAQLHNRVRPTAILSHSDAGAIAVYKRARAADVQVPDELSLVGFGDEGFAAFVQPPVTTLRFSPELVALSALTMLERQMERAEVPTQTLIPGALVIRDSAAAPP